MAKAAAKKPKALAVSPLTAAEVDALLSQFGFGREAKLAIAVSGGADSLALTLLVAEARPGQVTALTVDHGLRPDAAEEAAKVAKWLGKLEIPHEVLRWTGRKPKSNLQDAAREARYALMGDWCARNHVAALVTAHHQEDQAETLLLRLARGAGLIGLAGMTPVRQLNASTRLVRPLLGVPKAKLKAVLTARKQAWIEDPSNADERFVRVKARAVLDALAPLEISAQSLAETAQRLREPAHLFAGWAADLYRTAKSDGKAGLAIPMDALKAEQARTGLLVLRTVLPSWLQAVGSKAKPARGADVERLLGALLGKGFKGATLGGCQIKISRDLLRITPEAAPSR
jgi:tRNA(Ile)-lysidine synthase